MTSGALYNWIHRVWYEGSAGKWILLPLSAIYWCIISARRWMYRCGLFKTQRFSVPVIVVGNITAGGTGKTPTTVWLARELSARGFSPGIVSRGYGGSKSGSPMRVDRHSDAALVGDEPVLLAKRSECPVIVDADRVRAAEMLVEDGVDLIIADDGLQHYRLGRDCEVCIIDGARGLGNRHLLPAGPLREPVDRLYDVDQVLVNGRMRDGAASLSEVEQNALRFDLVATEAARLNGSLIRPLPSFKGTTVHAIAAIGNPSRFFDLLRSFDIQVIEHAHPDHAQLRPEDTTFHDDFDVLMTEKDAVKFGASAPDKVWYVPVEFSIDAVAAGPWLEQVESRIRAGKDD